MSTIITLWIICALASAGFCNAYLRTEYDYWVRDRSMQNWIFSLIWSSLGGPIALCLGFFAFKYFAHGWTLAWRRPSRWKPGFLQRKDLLP